MVFRRILALSMALILLFSAAALAQTAFPLTEEPVTFSVLSRTNNFYPNSNIGDVQNMVEYEKMTGVHMEWENVDPGVWAQTLSSVIASGDMPDIIFKGNVTNAQSYAWGSEGLLVDLAPYLEEYAPNFYALCRQYDDILKAITTSDGKIYGLPQVVPFAPMKMPDKLFYNEKALAATGMALPATTDELYDLLVAIRDGDFNGNGAADEVPLCASVNWLYRYFYGSFGVRTRGAHHNTVDVDPQTGELRVFAASDHYRKFLEYLHKLYAEKLIYQEIFTEGNKTTVLSSEERLGVVLDTTLYNVPTQFVDDWTGLKYQPAGPDGYAIASEARSTLHTEGNFVITSACQNVPLALQWVDYFYSEEGSLFFHAGVKDENWEVKSDGSMYYTDKALASRTADMTQDAFLAQFCLWPGGRNPSIMVDSLWGGEYEDEPAQTAYALLGYASDKIWPIISWTEEENDVITSLQKDIQSFIDTSTAQVIAGEVELTDAWWNDFVAQINAKGAQQLCEAYQSALTRIYGEASAF